MRELKITLNNGKVITYTKQCKHTNKQYLDTIDTYDMDGFSISRHKYICLDCGVTWEQ